MERYRAVALWTMLLCLFAATTCAHVIPQEWAMGRTVAVFLLGVGAIVGALVLATDTPRRAAIDADDDEGEDAGGGVPDEVRGEVVKAMADDLDRRIMRDAPRAEREALRSRLREQARERFHTALRENRLSRGGPLLALLDTCDIHAEDLEGEFAELFPAPEPPPQYLKPASYADDCLCSSCVDARSVIAKWTPAWKAEADVAAIADRQLGWFYEWKPALRAIARHLVGGMGFSHEVLAMTLRAVVNGAFAHGLDPFEYLVARWLEIEREKFSGSQEQSAGCEPAALREILWQRIGPSIHYADKVVDAAGPIIDEIARPVDEIEAIEAQDLAEALKPKPAVEAAPA